MRQPEIIAELNQREASYGVHPEVGRPLERVVGVPLVGPVGVGKTTLMRAASQLDPHFGRLVGFTTREQRPGEEPDTYVWAQHTQPVLESILLAVRAGHLAQYAMHPTGKVYGSGVSAYRHRFTMIDALAKAVGPLRRMPLKDLRPFYVVTPPEVWIPRAGEREAYTSPEEMQKRQREGVESLEWGLEQGDAIQWIDNSREPGIVAAELVARAQEPVADRVARRTGELLLKEMQRLL